MSNISVPFLDACAKGKALAQDIDAYVRAWHEGPVDESVPLHDFLGMTFDEYALWAERPEMLAYLLVARRHKISVQEAIAEADAIPLAARAATAEEAHQLIEWLKETNRL